MPFSLLLFMPCHLQKFPLSIEILPLGNNRLVCFCFLVLSFLFFLFTSTLLVFSHIMTRIIGLGKYVSCLHLSIVKVFPSGKFLLFHGKDQTLFISVPSTELEQLARDTWWQCFSNFKPHHSHSEDLSIHSLLGPPPEFLVQKTWDGGKEFAFSASLGDADAANSGTTLNHYLVMTVFSNVVIY